MNYDTFSASEALGLLGKQVRSCLELDGVPRGTPGRVINARSGGRCASGFSVAVRWQGAGGATRELEFTKSEFAHCLILMAEAV